MFLVLARQKTSHVASNVLQRGTNSHSNVQRIGKVVHDDDDDNDDEGNSKGNGNDIDIAADPAVVRPSSDLSRAPTETTSQPVSQPASQPVSQ